MSNLLKFSSTLGMLLILNFLINTSWPQIQENFLLSNMPVLVFNIIIIYLSFNILTKNTSLEYFFLVKKGIQLGLVAGIIAALFYYVYVSLLDPKYLQHVADYQAEKMRRNGFNEYSIKQAVKSILISGKFHFGELSMIFSSIFRSLGISLLLAGFFSSAKTENTDQKVPS